MSRMQSVYEIYQKEGSTKAIEFGRTLGLAEGTLKIYMWKFGKGITSSSTKRKPKISDAGRQQVHMGQPNKIRGVILEAGPSQTLVRWTEGSLLSLVGLEQCIPNKFLKKMISRVRL